jgi:ribosomal protein S18 acetylase RimI-like enzyme
VTFRRATAQDLPAIVALLADDVLGATREAPGDPAYAAAFVAIDADPNQLLAVAEQDGRVLGCLQLTFLPGLSHRGAWRGQIESVRVASDQRGTGLGRRFLEWAIAQCRARGCRMVQLTTDKSRAEARRFYESLGFTASHEGMKLAL